MSAVSAVAARAREGSARSEGVTIRFSQPGEDVEERVVLAHRACNEMGDPDLPFDEEIVRRGIARKLAGPERHCLLQAEAGEVQGVGAIVVMPGATPGDVPTEAEAALSFDAGVRGNRIRGAFFGPERAEIGGVFERNGILGAFGATRD